VAPWTRADRMQPFRMSPGQRAAGMIGVTLLIVLLTTSGVLARGHLAAGRGDRAGAFRLAAYTVVTGSMAWVLHAHHVAAQDEAGPVLHGPRPVLLRALLT